MSCHSGFTIACTYWSGREGGREGGKGRREGKEGEGGREGGREGGGREGEYVNTKHQNDVMGRTANL